jgi:hypothetical protein
LRQWRAGSVSRGSPHSIGSGISETGQPRAFHIHSTLIVHPLKIGVLTKGKPPPRLNLSQLILSQWAYSISHAARCLKPAKPGGAREGSYRNGNRDRGETVHRVYHGYAVPRSRGSIGSMVQYPQRRAEVLTVWRQRLIRNPRIHENRSDRNAPIHRRMKKPFWDQCYSFLGSLPRLKHQYRPKPRCPIPASGQMLRPSLADDVRVEQSIFGKTLGRQQVFGPITQRAAQP